MKSCGLVLPATLVLVIGLIGCTKKSSQEQVDYSLLRIDTEHMVLHHDTVGHDEWESQSTYALVDVYNQHNKDLMVSLGGDFTDASGSPVGPIRAESLRIPAGGVRTFAMVAKQRTVHRSATTARVQIQSAYVPSYPPSLQVTEGKVYRYDDRMVVNGVVRNAVDRPVRAIIIAGFYDSDGNLLQRPFTEMYIPGNGDSAAQFVGPPGSVKGYIFVGDMVF